MRYKSYATESYYLDTYEGILIPEDEIEKALKQASRHVDSLTYNRIVGRGFLNLTEFQQEIIREVICRQAEFEYENADEKQTYFRFLITSSKLERQRNQRQPLQIWRHFP